MENLKYSVKKSIFRNSMYIGGAMLISLGLQLLYSVVFGIVMGFLGYSAAEVSTITTDTWSGYLINSLILVVISTFPFITLKRLNDKPVYEICSFNSPRKGLSIPSVGFAFGGAMLANIVTSLFLLVLDDVFGFEAVQGQIGDNSYGSFFELIYTIVCAAVVPALFEEFAFRGMILGTLRKFGDMPAVLASAVLFAVYHGNFIQIPFAFLVGLFLGLITVITGSIWPAVIAHFANNAFSVIANAFSYSYIMITGYLFLIILVFGIISLIYLLKRRAFSNIQKKTTVISGESKFLRMLSAPTTIIFIVLMLITAFLSRA